MFLSKLSKWQRGRMIFFPSEDKTVYQGTYSYLKLLLHTKCLAWSDAKYNRELTEKWKKQSCMKNYSSRTLW